jgi:hypothetical protein
MSSKIVFGVALALASLLPANIGSAQDAPSLHKGPWPIRDGRNYQPTERELRALHQEDVTPDEACEIDRLYDQLLASSEKVRSRRPAPKHSLRGSNRMWRAGVLRCRFCSEALAGPGTWPFVLDSP